MSILNKTTLWYRYDFDKKKYVFNHAERGHSSKFAPTPVSEEQRKSWEDALWKKKRTYTDLKELVTKPKENE